MRALFKRAGRYAHINDPRSPQFFVSETEAKEGKWISGLSEKTCKTYKKTGACRKVEEEVDAEAEEEEVDDVKANAEDDKGSRQRGSRSDKAD